MKDDYKIAIAIFLLGVAVGMGILTLIKI